MFVINETESGGEMVCILTFSARPRDDQNRPASAGRRTFHIGERVRYCGYFFKATPEDNPTGYMAVFKPLDSDDRQSYAATADYFVTMECWDGLKNYLKTTGDKQPSKKASDQVHSPKSSLLASLSSDALPEQAREKQSSHGPTQPKAKPPAPKKEMIDQPAMHSGIKLKKASQSPTRKKTANSK